MIVPRLPEVQIPFESSERASLGVEWELQLIDKVGLQNYQQSMMGDAA